MVVSTFRSSYALLMTIVPTLAQLEAISPYLEAIKCNSQGWTELNTNAICPIVTKQENYTAKVSHNVEAIFIITKENAVNLDLDEFPFAHFIFRTTSDGIAIFQGCPNQGQVKQINYWDSLKGFSLSVNANLRSCQREMLRGKEIHGSIFGLPPFVIFSPTGNFRGTDVDILKTLGQVMGFKVKFTWQRVWGSRIPGTSGAWSGTIGNVKNKTSTVGIGHVLLQEDRFEAVDYILTYQLPIFLLAPHPARISPAWSMFRPFSITVWSMVAATFLLVGAFQVIIFTVEGKNVPYEVLINVYGSQWNQREYIKVAS